MKLEGQKKGKWGTENEKDKQSEIGKTLCEGSGPVALVLLLSDFAPEFNHDGAEEDGDNMMIIRRMKVI